MNTIKLTTDTESIPLQILVTIRILLSRSLWGRLRKLVATAATPYDQLLHDVDPLTFSIRCSPLAADSAASGSAAGGPSPARRADR